LPWYEKTHGKGQYSSVLSELGGNNEPGAFYTDERLQSILDFKKAENNYNGRNTYIRPDLLLQDKKTGKWTLSDIKSSENDAKKGLQQSLFYTHLIDQQAERYHRLSMKKQET
jgi:hypothetical protein